MIYQPTIATSKNELKSAIGSQKSIIALKNDAAFWEIEASEKKALETRKATDAGGNILMLGGVAAAGTALASGLLFSVFLPPALLVGGAAALATGGGAKLAAGQVTKALFRKHYQEYCCLFDYDNTVAFFIKLAGESKIEQNDRPWVDLNGVYSPIPERIDLRMPNGSTMKSRIDNGILKLLVD